MSTLNKPRHPDYELLTKAVRDNDSETEHAEVPEVIGKTVDLDTALWVADQRVHRLFEHFSATLPDEVRAVSMSLWLDGLLAGYKLAQARNTEAAG